MDKTFEPGSGSGSDRPSKKATGAVVPGAPFLADTNSDIIAAAVAQQAEEPQQQQQQHELPVEPPVVVEPQENETATSNVEMEIEDIKKNMAENRGLFTQAKKEHEFASKALLALTRSASLESLPKDIESDESFFCVITAAQSSENPAQYLLKFMEEKREEISSLHETYKDQTHSLRLKEEERLRGRKASGMMFSEPQGNPTHSGLRYIEKIFRIEYVGDDNDSHDIGLVEKVDTLNSPTEFRIKKNIETWGPCRELVEAWPVIPMGDELDTSDRTFLNELLPHVRKLNGDLIENAWKSLTKKMQLTRNTASEMTMQQCICTPFIELFIAAAGNVESDEYIADELLGSSLTLLCKVHEGDQYEEKRLSIKPDAAVALKQNWDAFGIVEMKRGMNVSEKEYLRDIDKCTLMAATTAILVGRSINDKSRHDEIAIPLVILRGYTCHLYVATLDERGIPRMKLVKFTEEDKTNANTPSAEHVIARSPCRSRTELFVVLAILLNKLILLMDRETRNNYLDDFINRASKIKRVSTYS